MEQDQHHEPIGALMPDQRHVKPISSVGVNAAFLTTGERCVSIGHSICALIVLSNGIESFVAHLATPDGELIGELTKIRDALGGDVTAKIYHVDVGNAFVRNPPFRPRNGVGFGLRGFRRMLESVVDEAHIEEHGGSGAYLVTPDGHVDPLGHEEDPHYREVEQAYADAGQTFASMHEHQPVAAVERVPLYWGLSASNTAFLDYADIPHIFTDKHNHFKVAMGKEVDHVPDAKSWNEHVRQMDAGKDEHHR